MAQADDDIPVLPLNGDLILPLDGVNPLVVGIDITTPQTVLFIVQSHGENVVDPTVEILKPNGERLAYNDDCGDFIAMEYRLKATDSMLFRLTLSESGRYLARINSFNGVSQGEVLIRIPVIQPITAIRRTDSAEKVEIEVVLPLDTIYSYEFEAQADETLTITAHSRRSDPVLKLRDATGAIIAQNDDHNSEDLTLNIFDARITVTLAETGTYTLELSEFLGRGGAYESVEITIEREP